MRSPLEHLTPQPNPFDFLFRFVLSKVVQAQDNPIGGARSLHGLGMDVGAARSFINHGLPKNVLVHSDNGTHGYSCHMVE